MKNSLVCPKCANDTIYAMQLFGAIAKSGLENCLESAGLTDQTELWICGSCGFTERYTVDAAELLDQLSTRDDSGVKKFTKGGGGYR